MYIHKYTKDSKNMTRENPYMQVPRASVFTVCKRRKKLKVQQLVKKIHIQENIIQQ